MENNNDLLQPTADRYLKLTHAIYLLQALGYFTFLPVIVAIILNYICLDDVRGSWLESHFRWQIKTFWFFMVWFILGSITLLLGIGWFILVATYIWVVYRIIKGWLRLSESKEMYVDNPAAS